MNVWLSENFYDNKKIKRLMLELGADAIPCLHKLWFYAAKYAIDNLLDEKYMGILKDFDDVDIELTAGWVKEPGEFVKSLKSLKLLDEKYGQIYIHDFADNNPHLTVLIKQKINGSKYARLRWEGKQNGGLMGDPQGDLIAKEKKRKEKRKKKKKKESDEPIKNEMSQEEREANAKKAREIINSLEVTLAQSTKL